MTRSDLANIISLAVTKFPQNLLIPNGENAVSFQVTSNSQKEENLRFAFKGENLDIIIEPEEFTREIKFNPKEVKNVNLRLVPTADGYGKLNISVYWLKIVEYTVKVQKIREVISKSKIKKILGDKMFFILEFDDKFSPNDYLITTNKSDIKKLEKDLKFMKESLGGVESAGSLKEVDTQIKNLAKCYLSLRELYKGLETGLQLSDETERIDFYYNLLRAYATINLVEVFQVIKGLNDKNKKNEVIRLISLDYSKSNPEQVNNIISLIEDPSLKDKVLIDIIGILLRINPQFALKYSHLIKDDLMKVKALFNIIKVFYENKKEEDILPIIKQINYIMINSNQINLTDNNTQHPDYQLLKDSICILAELDSPESADSTIKQIKTQEIREKVAKELFNELYEMVDERRQKIEPTIVFSQYYLLNVYSSKISNEIKNFSQTGGNVSNNLLMREYDFKNAFISLFSLSFSIFPIIDRVYTDLKYNEKKSIAYYIYPTTENHDSEELKIMQSTLRQFFPSHNISNQVNIFNLDFIPYLGKPTVILTSDRDDTDLLKSKIKQKIGDRANILVDDSIFRGGIVYDNLNEIFIGNNLKLYNLVLSYEFINDYDLFKAFIQSLT